jgi:hypothetical protein
VEKPPCSGTYVKLLFYQKVQWNYFTSKYSAYQCISKPGGLFWREGSDSLGEISDSLQQTKPDVLLEIESPIFGSFLPMTFRSRTNKGIAGS